MDRDQKQSQAASRYSGLAKRGYRMTPNSADPMVGRAVSARRKQVIKKRPVYEQEVVLPKRDTASVEISGVEVEHVQQLTPAVAPEPIAPRSLKIPPVQSQARLAPAPLKKVSFKLDDSQKRRVFKKKKQAASTTVVEVVPDAVFGEQHQIIRESRFTLVKQKLTWGVRSLARIRPADVVFVVQSIPSFARSLKRERLMYAMATSIFVFGMGTAIYGFNQTRNAENQIAVLTGAAGNSGVVLGAVTPDAPNQEDRIELPDETPVSQEQVINYVVPDDQPKSLRIDALGVNARVLRLDQTPEGAVDTPRSIYDVGWYQRSAKPGDQSGAILAVAHYSGLTQLGVFGGLKNLTNGDIIEMEQGDGTVHRFKVVEMESYDRTNVDMKKALKPANPQKLGLNLITCGGSFDHSVNQYSERLLVRTEKI